MKDDRLISLNAAIALFEKYGAEEDAIALLSSLPPAQPETAEKLYLYKCYITDKDGLQHEVIHTGDIRRVTGWEI